MNLAVGFFDGVHLGHRRILAHADAALTFRNHPATIFAPSRAPALLMTRDCRLSTIAATLRADSPMAKLPITNRVRALDFTPELARQSPRAFVDWLKSVYPDLETVFCGANWTFGAAGAGDATFLQAQGVSVEVVPYAEAQGLPISSTRIRTMLAAGEMASAAELLGHPWTLEGRIVRGKGLGRKLGFPTVNLLPAEGLVRPPLGVYAVQTPWGNGLANYGYAPTMGACAWTEPILEVHLLQAPAEMWTISEQDIAIEMTRFIRPERKFESLEQLQQQILHDISNCREGKS